MILRLLDRLAGKGMDITRTYLDLFCRNWEEGYIDVSDELEAAYLANLDGKRGHRSWVERIRALEAHGFIEIKPSGPRAIGTILLIDPLRAVSKLRKEGKVGEEIWLAILRRMSEFSMDLPGWLVASEEKLPEWLAGFVKNQMEKKEPGPKEAENELEVKATQSKGPEKKPAGEKAVGKKSPKTRPLEKNRGERKVTDKKKLKKRVVGQ